MKRTFLLIVALCVFSFAATAQDPQPKQISGGVLNGKAVSLPKPAYPPAAMAANAEGAVSVQVLIDETGNVISAEAISGHPLLRVAATEAARGAKFSPTLLQGEPVKVSGVITYNFVSGVTTNAGLGYEIAYAERTGSFTPYVMPKSLAARLPEEWAEEKLLLEGLQLEKSPLGEISRSKATEPAATSPASEEDQKLKRAMAAKYTIKGDLANEPGRLTSASLESLRRLQAGVRSRLGSDVKNEWHFRLGTALGVFAAEIDDAGKSAQNIAEIEELAATAPAGVSQNVTKGLAKFIELAKTSDGSSEARKLLLAAAQGLRNLRI